ncbi:MAG TPA: FtsX-like permease family protein, partial [Actinomycetota bacterium]|nr:FtsX-like permease family protein [Actinomycetota bacterium]
MTTFRFLVARFLAQRLLTLATVVTLAFTIGVLVAGPIYADAAREAILASALRGAAVTVRNLRLSVYGGPGFDLAGTDAEVAAALEPLPLRSLVREGLAEVRLAAGPRVLSAPVLFRTGAALHLDLRGRAPEGPGEVALPSSTARRLRVRLGETLRALGPTGERTVLRVVGTFAPPDPRDPFWFGSGSPFPPPDSTSPSPALVAPQAFPAVAGELGLTAMYAWDAYLALDGRPYEEVRTVPARIAAAVRHLRGLPGLERLATVTGLDTLMELVRQRVENLRAPISLVVVQIAAVALAVLAGVASLALTRQAFELAVLHSRGFPRRALLSAQAVQGALAALAALPLGLAVGVGLARLASRSNGPGLPGVLFPVRLSPIAVALAVGGCL